MNKVSPYGKAITGAVIAALGALGAVLVGDQGLGDVTSGQWVTIALAFLVALGGIWAIPNSEITTEEPTP